jgi:alkanesulfonate monooxygenase SsuD/methylene tetrahydromethanopterin reductase-like flavin-dependent oxidoreductase (luciferase family)
MCHQARLAEAAGFDGLMTSEHHGGFPGYLPNPLQLAGWLLDSTSAVWAAPCPLLLPLKHWSHVAEEIAWLAARFPGRVGAGFAAGGLAQDFEMADLDFAKAGERFRAAMPLLGRALRGEAEAPLSEDPAIAACAEAPIPLTCAAQGPVGARRAARFEMGALYDSLQTLERMRVVTDAYREAGGAEACTAIRRVWIGTPPGEQVEAQMKFYRGYAPEEAKAHWGKGQELVHGENGASVADQLLEVASRGGCDAFNLRIHAQGIPAEAVREQISALGEETLPLLRREWAGC